MPVLRLADDVIMRIRRARPTDLNAMVDLEQQCFTVYRISRRQLRMMIGLPAAIVLVAKSDGEIVGDAIGLIRRTRGPLVGNVYSLAVDSKTRGRGVGRKLLLRLLAEFSRAGVVRIRLEVEADNVEARALYESAGFELESKLPNYYGRRRHGIRMLRRERPISRRN